MTKEKFLRAIVGDPPLVVGHNENVELEAQLAEVKAELKQRKEEVRVMVEEMETMGRDLAKRTCIPIPYWSPCYHRRSRSNDSTSTGEDSLLTIFMIRLQEYPITDNAAINSSRIN